MSVRNETEIQLLKILFKTQKKKPTKNLTSRRAYPHGVEQKYYRQLKGFFKPLTDYVQKYIDENVDLLLKGDSKEINLDAIPGPSYRKMIYNLEDWLSIYMPDIADLPSDSNNNLILLALGKTANETADFGEKEFQRIIEQGIHVDMPTSASWWEDMKSSWMEDNYTLITSNAKNYVSKINTLTEQAIVNGLSMNKLKEEIQKVTTGLSEKHCKLLARDQIGKLNGQINQAQMEELGLDLYVWSTAFDDRVRDSHSIMEGLLCRWDDANVCSYDNGKTWQDRPSGAVLLHPGQDIQCRCVGLAFYPELIAEMENKPLNEVIEENDFVVSEIQNNLLSDLPDEQKEIYDGIYNELKEFDGNRNNAIEISYACVTGDFTKIPESFFNKSNVEWANTLTRLNKSMELYESRQYALNEFNIARDLFQKGKSLPKFTCTEKELADYIEYLKKNKILESYEKIFSSNYGYEKYFAFAKELGLSEAGQKTYYRGLMDYFNFENKNLEKLIYEQFSETNRIYGYAESKYITYFDKNLSRTNLVIGDNFNVRDLLNITSEAGLPWGTADIRNESFRAIAQFDHEITPFDKSTQKLKCGLKIKINSKEVAQGIAQKLYCEENYPLTKKLSTKSMKTTRKGYAGESWKYRNDEFLRLEFSYTGKPQNYKVGDILKQTGVFATTPSELHNAIWYDSKIKNGATYPVRFHLKRDEKAHKYLANVIQNDLHVARHGIDNPEEFDFAIGKVKITKIKDGYINGNKKYPVKEIWIEIVE